MEENKYFSLKNKIPLLVLLIWISVIGYFIWQRVNQSERIPIFDALTYYEKAQNFWNNVHQGFPQNPLNVGPAARPPGTVLLSYPFGFDEDYHGFLFRSVFIPFLIWVITILILMWPPNKKGAEKTYWPVTIAVLLLGPFPFFFQFDYGHAAYWGLVDSFLAAMSALSLALAIKSIQKKSKSLLITAILTVAICPFIKPSGCFIFLLIAICWSGLCLIWAFNKNIEEKKGSIKFWWFGSALFFLTGIIILYLVLSSEYLGHGTVSFFTQAMSVLNTEYQEYTTLSVFFSIFYKAVGPQFLLYTSLFIFLLMKYGKKVDSPIPFRVLLLASFLFILIGTWFWILMTGISQIRYFYPFLLLGFVPLLFYTHQLLSWDNQRKPSVFHQILIMIYFLPAINLIILLSIVNPNDTWQEISGVGLNISLHDPGVKTAKQFLSYIANEKERSTVYDTNLGHSNNSFTSYGFFDHLIHPEVAGYTSIHPIDWARPSTLRLTEIITNSNYIIFRPFDHETQARILEDSIINGFDEEVNVIEAFLNSLTPIQGLQALFEDQDCRLSKITDKNKLIRAFEPFLYSRKWRTLFTDENKITPQGWKLFKIPFEGLPKGYTLDTSRDYAGLIELVNGISPSDQTAKVDGEIILDGWLAYDIKKGIKADEIFVEVDYPDGTRQYWPTNKRSRPDISEKYHQPDLKDTGFNSFIDVKRQKGIITLMLALGYKGKITRCSTINTTIKNE